MGVRGYGKVRISVIDDGSNDFEGFFEHSAPFAHVPPGWSHLHLHSGIKDVPPGGAATFLIGGHEVTVRLPGEGARTRGVFLADPCMDSRDMVCAFQERFRVHERLGPIIDTLVSSPEVDYWGIVGDNFYEMRGSIAEHFFAGLSAGARAKPFLTVPGNHDFWIMGAPAQGRPDDQYGNGFMQYYGQDTEAGLGAAPFDLSVDPATRRIPDMRNFVFSHQIGDVAFLGFSGAHPRAEFQPYGLRFCAWLAGASTVNTAVLLGHWNAPNLGCMPGMSTPEVYSFLKEQPGCREKTLLFVEGHEHCNRVHVPDHGFLIGANGMSDCEQFGFIVVDSDPGAPEGPNVRVDYFEIAGAKGDNYDGLLSCLKQQGYTKCRESYAVQWRVAATSPYVAPVTQAPAPLTTRPTTSAAPGAHAARNRSRVQLPAPPPWPSARPAPRVPDVFAALAAGVESRPRLHRLAEGTLSSQSLSLFAATVAAVGVVSLISCCVVRSVFFAQGPGEGEETPGLGKRAALRLRSFPEEPGFAPVEPHSARWRSPTPAAQDMRGRHPGLPPWGRQPNREIRSSSPVWPPPIAQNACSACRLQACLLQ